MRLVLVALVIAALAISSCDKAPYGGEKESALIAATAAHDVAKVRALLDSGANPNRMVKFEEGLYQSPWRQVLRQLRPKHPEDAAIVKAMLQAGADPAVAWGEGQALSRRRLHQDEPLLIVMMNPNADVVRLLLDAGLKPQSGVVALVSAADAGEAGIVRMLVEAGVNVNGANGGRTPLLAAIERRDAKIMAYLEAHGARERP
ncbi:MAG TPA: ankyrin repeat domain-containing protein [Vicinamibacterales bacterium]|nr:ankyrin repeat domain-containing protein [Vicinamibacterales bacterium]